MPAPVKVLLTVALALIALPPGPAWAVAPGAGLPEVAVLLAAEALIGASLGFAARAVLSAAAGAGDLLGFQSGVNVGHVLDPLSGHPSNPLSILEGSVALQVFLAAGGLGWMAVALARSYAAVPPMAGVAPEALGARIAALGGWVVEGSLLLLAPALIAAVLLDLLLLTVGRAAPSIQLMVVALPLKVWVGIALLAAATYRHAPVLAALMDRVKNEIEGLLGLMGPVLQVR